MGGTRVGGVSGSWGQGPSGLVAGQGKDLAGTERCDGSAGCRAACQVPGFRVDNVQMWPCHRLEAWEQQEGWGRGQGSLRVGVRGCRRGWGWLALQPEEVRPAVPAGGGRG